MSASNAAAFDSRYFGQLAGVTIFGIAHQVWVWKPNHKYHTFGVKSERRVKIDRDITDHACHSKILVITDHDRISV